MDSDLPWRRFLVAMVLAVYVAYKCKRFVKDPKAFLAWLCATTPQPEGNYDLRPITDAKAHVKFAKVVNDTWSAGWNALYAAFYRVAPFSVETNRKILVFLITCAAPFWEESVKRHVPCSTTAIAVIEASALMTAMASSPMPILSTNPQVLFPSLIVSKYVLHTAFRKFRYPELGHALFNTVVGLVARDMPTVVGSFTAAFLALPARAMPPPSSLEQFKQDYHDVKSHEEEYVPFEPLTTNEAFLPAIQSAPTYQDCPIAQDAVLEAGVQEGVFLLLATTQCFYRPNGPLNLWHAYQQRNLEEVPITYICEEAATPPLPHQVHPWTHCVFKPYSVTKCPIDRAWKIASRLMIKLISSGPLEEPEPFKSKDWEAHFKGAAKKARAREAIMNRNQGIVAERSGIFLKADEVLYGRETGLKGRTVKSVDPTVQALTYQAIDAAIKKLKSICDGKTPWQQGNWRVTFAVGSGRTAEQLDQWFEIGLDWVSLGENRIAAVFAGDDFYALVNENGTIHALENDFAKFDRTQGVHALGAEYRVLRVLGVSGYQCRVLFDTMLAQPRYETKKFEYRKNLWMPPQRATGGPDTTLGNTLTNMMSVLYFLESNRPLTELAISQLRLGFMAKLQRLSNITMGTFLKGWWIPGPERAVWVPLPSQVIKLGKIMTNPVQIFPQLPPPQAWKAAASSMAASYGYVPREYPILGVFLSRYYSLSEVQAVLPGEEAFHYRIKRSDQSELSRDIAIEMICERYSITPEDIQMLEDQIRETPFPGIMTHPTWALLARRDYG